MTPFPNSEIIIERIGWLLFHSLWQFALIGITAALLFWLLRGARPATRYALGLAFLAAIVLAPILTWPFIPIAPAILATSATPIPMELAPPSPAPHIAASPLNHVNSLDIPTTARNFPIEAPNDRPHTITSAVAPPVPPIPWMERLTIALNPWLETCVALWCGGVLLFSLRPLIGWIAQRRLRRIGTHPLTVQLAGTWEQARQRLRIRQRVQLLQSTLAPGPMVVGYLQPIILLPTTVVNSLPARRIEAILLHELAHIRRHDWLVNTLQTLVETLFFHHPAVWWLSARIRHERELCCDEIAAQALGDRAEYGRALVDLENLRDVPLLALSARGGSLLDRIRRLTRTEVPRSNSTALVSLAVATLLLISLGAWSVGEAEGKQRPEPPDSLLMSLDEQKAWEELIAMNLNSPEVSRRNMRLQRLKRVETSHFPDDQIQELRRQLQEPIRSMHPWNIPEEAWPLIARLKSLETLTVTAGDLPRAAFESIAKLPKLKSLRVINARCLPTDAVALNKATNLEELDFMFTIFDMSPEARQALIGEQTPAEQAWAESYRKKYDNREHIIEAAILTDRMLEELRELPNLKRITLTNTSVSSRGAVAIAAHAGLEKLDVNFIDFSPEAARAIGSLKELRHFQVAEGTNDETLSNLAGLTNLEFLQLWGNSITDAGTAHLTKLHSLRYLNLYNSSLSDSGLLELAKLRHLKRLQLGSSKTTFTQDGIAEFRRLLPECELVVTEPKTKASSPDPKGEEKQPTEAPTPKPLSNTADSNTKSKPATPSTFTGRVVDIDGKPIPGAFVAFSPTLKKDGKWLEYTTTADERGHFELTFPDIMADADSPVVSRTIWAWHEGFSIGGSILENDSRQSGASLEITLPEPYPRAFQILAPGGKPLANARLNPVSMTVPQLSDRLKGGTNQHDRIPESLQARCTVTSDASGRITMTSVAQHMPGLWQVSTEDFGDQFLYALGGELRLSEVAELRGVVEGIQHPTLLHMASLHDSDKESIGGSSAFVLTDANGQFHTPKVVVGPLEILEVSEEAHSEDDARAITLDRIEIKPGKNEIQLIRESKKPLVDETSPANSATPKGTHSDENTGEPTAMREWSGQIIDEKGRPLEGVRVVPTGWLDISGHFTRGFPLIEPTRVSPTDKQGNFSVSIHRDAVPEDWQVVTFIRISSFHQPTIVLSRDPLRLQVMSRTDFNAAFAPSAAHNKNTAKERIKKPNSLSGQVIDQHGKPFPGAFVVCAAETLRDGKAREITTIADDKGRFILEFPASIFGNEPRTASKTVWAWHEGLAMGFVKCTIDDILAGRDLWITLPPAFHRSFRILDPKGQPLANAEITPDHLYTPAFNNDIGGSFRLPAALKARVRKTSNDAGSVTVESVAEHQYESWQVRTEELGIQLFHGRQGNLQYSDVASISGEVEGLQAPILLKIFSAGQSNTQASIGRSLEIVLTDDNGLFEIPRFATGPATVMSLRNSTVGKQGTALLKHTPIDVTPGKMKLQLQAEQGIRVRGRIVDERTQKGITGASVTLLSNVGESGGLEHVAWVGDTTDTNGEFDVLGVPGSALLSVNSNQHPEHFHQTSFFKIEAGAEEIRLSEMQKKPHGSLTQARILKTIPDSATAK